MQKGKLYIVATPIGNLDDMSKRAIDTLNNVDIIIAEDTRTSGQLLKHFDIKTNAESYHKFNEIDKSKQVIKYLLEGKNIALISDAGTPGISDPGNVIVKECIENKIDIVPIPGACAFIQALICSGFDTINFSFFGFLPVEKKERKLVLEKIQNATTNLVVLYESPHKLLKTLNDLKEELGNCELSISREITKMYEEHLKFTIDEAIDHYTNKEPKGEFVLVIKKETKKEIEASLDDKTTQENITKEYTKLKKDFNLKEISNMLSEEYKINKKEIYTFLAKIK